MRVNISQNGFTLSEMMISIMLVGVLATLLIPSMSVGADQSTQLNAVRTGANELVNVYLKIDSSGTSSIGTSTTAQQLINNMNYVRLINDGSKTTQIVTGAGNVTTTTTCNAVTPCALLQTGAYLQYNPQSVFSQKINNQYGMRFIIDPDGSGSKLGTEFILFYGPRLTTYFQYQTQRGISGENEVIVSNLDAFGAVTTNLVQPSPPNLPTSPSPIDALPNSISDPSYLNPWLGG